MPYTVVLAWWRRRAGSARGELELAPMFDEMRVRVVTYRAVEPNGMQS